MLAQKDESIDAAVDTAFRLMSDDAIRERVFAREDYYRNQRSLQRWAESQRLKAEENQKKAEEYQKQSEEYQKQSEENQKKAEKNQKKAEENLKRAEDAEAENLRLRELLRKSGIDAEADRK